MGDNHFISSFSLMMEHPLRIFANMIKQRIYIWLIVTLLLSNCYNVKKENKPFALLTTEMQNQKYKIATLGAGCFWCVETIFEELQGVISVESGYMGGHTKNPTYKEVCTETTGHAEVARIIYDPEIISFKDILEVFWQTHDPTTLNKQGNDTGTQYRSAVFYHSEKQKEEAEFYKNKLEESAVFSNPIVTEITPATDYYVAEDYHQNYYQLNSEASYCQYVIKPKVEKFRKVFKDKLKDGIQ